MKPFNQIRMELPKLTQQFITKKQAYLAKTDDRIIIKISKNQIIALNSDSTYELFDNIESIRSREKCEQADREPFGNDIFGGNGRGFH